MTTLPRTDRTVQATAIEGQILSAMLVEFEQLRLGDDDSTESDLDDDAAARVDAILSRPLDAAEIAEVWSPADQARPCLRCGVSLGPEEAYHCRTCIGTDPSRRAG
jgi:hypothetical protein